MLSALLVASVLALAHSPASNDPVRADTTIELVVAEDDTVSGTATSHVALDESRWDTDRFGPAGDAAAIYERSPEDLQHVDELLADHEGVTVERAERDGDPFGHSGMTVRFDTLPFEQFNTVAALLHDSGHLGTVLTVSREQGTSDLTPEGVGPHHRFDGDVNPPPLEVRPDLDHSVSVSVTFAGLVYFSDGDRDDRTVTWTGRGSIAATAATEEEGHPWLWWFLLALVVVLGVWRQVQQGDRRERERQGEIAPRQVEVEGYILPIHR